MQIAMNNTKARYPLLDEIQSTMRDLAPCRPSALFTQFLVNGYSAITLSSIPEHRFLALLDAKLCLGTLITLYDDYADRPSQYNPEMLETLYRLSITDHDSSLLPPDSVFTFAKTLFKRIHATLMDLPHYQALIRILEFDLSQFYTANRMSTLLTAYPHLRNLQENRLYAHHNMGMVIVGMMDLMAVPGLKLSELGHIREVFLMGQRMGRIFNVLATYGRESKDGDITSELSIYKESEILEVAKQELIAESKKLHQKILGMTGQITTFSVDAYAGGLAEVQCLHEAMEGIL